MKKCFQCKESKPLDQFYSNPSMKDGRVNKCKECTIAGVKRNREENLEYYRAYDRRRGNRQPAGYQREYRKKYPNKAKAHRKVAYAIRKGNLFSEPCAECGSEDTHAHHDDYAKPLNVRWLCAAHHRQWHVENGEGKNP